MPTVAISDTEINPTYFLGVPTVITDTEINPTYVEGHGGGRRELTDTELPPTLPAPEVTTDPATGIGPISATLNGTLDDEGLEPCDCGFEWGETVAYGNTTPTQRRTASS